ncbi:unnamed protein product [Ectocarpus sp. 4 AP-2014]
MVVVTAGGRDKRFLHCCAEILEEVARMVCVCAASLMKAMMHVGSLIYHRRLRDDHFLDVAGNTATPLDSKQAQKQRNMRRGVRGSEPRLLLCPYFFRPISELRATSSLCVCVIEPMISYLFSLSVLVCVSGGSRRTWIDCRVVRRLCSPPEISLLMKTRRATQPLLLSSSSQHKEESDVGVRQQGVVFFAKFGWAVYINRVKTGKILCYLTPKQD